MNARSTIMRVEQALQAVGGRLLRRWETDELIGWEDGTYFAQSLVADEAILKSTLGRAGWEVVQVMDFEAFLDLRVDKALGKYGFRIDPNQRGLTTRERVQGPLERLYALGPGSGPGKDPDSIPDDLSPIQMDPSDPHFKSEGGDFGL
jgi:hypothetical protein